MTSRVVPAVIVMVFAAGCLAGAWMYFRRVRMTPPAMGVLNLFDIGVMVTMIVAMPFLYLAVPPLVMTVLLTLILASVLQFVLEPLLGLAARWAVVAGLLGAELVVFAVLGADSPLFFVANNLVIAVVVIGTANLWAQSGLRCRAASVLAGALAVYDIVFTTVLTVTGAVFQQAMTHPFPPFLYWTVGNDTQVGLGQGDLLLASVFPLITLRSYGRRPALVMAGATVGVLAVLFGGALTDALPAAFPVMVALGPVQVALTAYNQRKAGAERTTVAFREMLATAV